MWAWTCFAERCSANMPTDLFSGRRIGSARAVVLLATVLVLAACTTSRSGSESRPTDPAAGATSPTRAASTTPLAPRTTHPPTSAPRRATSAPPRLAADPGRAGLVGDGVFTTVPVAFPATAKGRIVPYAVQIEQGIPIDARDFAVQVHTTLIDPRGWQGVDHVAFMEVASAAAAAIIVTLATPRTTDQLCAPLDTGGWLDCFSRGRAVINSDRWFLGSASYGSDIANYRHEVVNHEVGHGLGHDHLYCPGPGQLAPVMQQQTISLQGCRPNPWPSATGG